MVHRDIKPANVMLTSSGQAKIADFGIARIESSSMTQAGTVLGTPAYMSPEQFMGQVVDARTDIYSSGVLLYQLLTGERPFEGSMSAIMHKALNTEPPAPSQLSVTAPPSFDAVVRRAMAKRPEDRFASASAFAEAMQRRPGATRRNRPSDEDETTMVARRRRPPRPRRVSSAPATPRSAREARPPPALDACRHRRRGHGGARAPSLGGGRGRAWLLLRRRARQPRSSPRPVPPAPPPAAECRRHRADAASRRVPPRSETARRVPRRPSAAATVHRMHQQLALAGLDALRRQIAQWANSRSCAVLEGDVAEGGVGDS